MPGEKDFSEMIENMKDKVQKIQTEMDQLKSKGQAGAGLDIVQIMINGSCSCTKVKIAPSLLVEDKKEILEELIAGAFNNAVKELSNQKTKKIESLSGGISSASNLKLPF